jgi:putative transposase
MKINIQPLEAATMYHIYNRGINSGKIFSDEKNYYYFLKLYSKYISLVADTYAYCLLGNHFHFLIKTREEFEIKNEFKHIQNRRRSIDKNDASYHISNQFSKFFNSYSQAYNKMYKRTGALIESPFRRKEVYDDQYFSEMVYYIHANPSKHRICNNFTKYQYSSYNAYIFDGESFLKKEAILNWFGSKEEFINYHLVGTSGRKVLIPSTAAKK